MNKSLFNFNDYGNDTPVPSGEIILITDGDEAFDTRNLDQYIEDRNVIIVGIPGAFTPTCSTFQLPDFEKMYYAFKAKGIDEIYCVSVNDSFVMNAWAKSQNIENVKVIPDGSGLFTVGMGMLVSKDNLGFGQRSWRYAAVINDGTVEHWFEEPGKENNCPEDPYGVSSPQNIFERLQ